MDTLLSVQPTVPSSLTPVMAVVAAGGAAALLSFALTALLIQVGHRSGALDSAGAAGHHKQLKQVPNIGGIAIATTVLMPAAVGLLLIFILGADRLAEWFPSLAASAQRAEVIARPGLFIIGGALCLHLLGLLDDRRALSAWPKLIVQIAVAIAVVAFGGIRVLSLLDVHVGGSWLSLTLTVIFIVALINAVNFLDNMDGLAGGVSLIAALFLCTAACFARQWSTAGVLAVLVGALLGFLVFNFPWRKGRTAQIFMGDGGSLPVGFLLATLAVQITYTAPEDPLYALGTHWYGVLAPLVILAVPLYDSLTVTRLRLAQGKSPMVGDHQHFSHRLVMRGFTPRASVFLICALGAVCGVGGLLIGTAAPWQAVLVVLQTALVLLTIAALEQPLLKRMRSEDRP